MHYILIQLSIGTFGVEELSSFLTFSISSETDDLPVPPAKIAKTIDVKKNIAPKNVVNFVNALAVPLAVINPPEGEPPIPNPPPSLL